MDIGEITYMKVLQDINTKEWSDFVYEHPHGTIFQTPVMYEVYKQTKHYEPITLALVSDDGSLLGVLLAVIQREYSGIIGSMTTRSIIWGGPLVKDDEAELCKFILGEYDGIVRKHALYSQFRNLWDIKICKKVFEYFDYSFDEHLNIVIDLSISEQALWDGMYPQKRNKIRKALKAGTTVRQLDDLNDIEKAYEILCHVYERAKLPIAGKSLFIQAYDAHIVKFFGAFNNNTMIGVRCILVYRHTLYDWYAGSLWDYRDRYPNDLLPWEVIKWGRAHGYTTFDFGGAGRPGEKYGVRDFKKQFGGSVVNYGRFEKIHQPGKYRMAKMSFSLWQKLKKE
jgi:serine/alanine adding enzyme